MRRITGKATLVQDTVDELALNDTSLEAANQLLVRAIRGRGQRADDERVPLEGERGGGCVVESGGRHGQTKT